MFVPLVDSLRCPNQHDETWLVASIERAEERDIKQGVLGCPSCYAEYPVVDGVVRFDSAVVRPPFVAPDERHATRIAAALDLTDPRMTALLVGAWGAHAPLIRAMSPVQLLLVNPPKGIVSGDAVSIILADGAPLAGSSMDAVAVDATVSDATVARLSAALRGGRRMLGPISRAVPSFLKELVRDDEVWVAELEPGAVTSAPVLPTRRSRTENR
ncbi:MAG TPA: hypothetical protein VGM82_01115 [Gemmatimonadaceae bacterium]|jgi:uncharacterized protein YbaR (Trm112 family)